MDFQYTSPHFAPAQAPFAPPRQSRHPQTQQHASNPYPRVPHLDGPHNRHNNVPPQMSAYRYNDPRSYKNNLRSHQTHFEPDDYRDSDPHIPSESQNLSKPLGGSKLPSLKEWVKNLVVNDRVQVCLEANVWVVGVVVCVLEFFERAAQVGYKIGIRRSNGRTDVREFPADEAYIKPLYN